MSDTVERCLHCGHENPGLRVDCVSCSAMHDTQMTVNGRAAYRVGGAIRDQWVMGCACPGCAVKAIKAKARATAVKWAIGGFGGVFLILYVLSGVPLPGRGQPLFENAPLVPFLAVAAVAGVLCGLLRARKLFSLPQAFGVAFLLDKQDKNGFRHLPAEKSVYPGADEAAKKRYFLRLDLIPGDSGGRISEEIWNGHMK